MYGRPDFVLILETNAKWTGVWSASYPRMRYRLEKSSGFVTVLRFIRMKIADAIEVGFPGGTEGPGVTGVGSPSGCTTGETAIKECLLDTGSLHTKASNSLPLAYDCTPCALMAPEVPKTRISKGGNDGNR
jgi:hypothetical protein